MSETYCPNNQEEISQFIYDSYELNKPIEITTLNSNLLAVVFNVRKH